MAGSYTSEGSSRLLTGYGALDNAFATQEYEGVFSDEWGLEKFYIGDLNRRYSAEIGGSDIVTTQESQFSPVPLGSPPMIGEDLGQGLTLKESQLVKTTYHPQPEAAMMEVGRQPESNLWRAVDGFTIPGVPVEYNAPLVAVGIAAVAVAALFLLKKKKMI